MPWDSTLLSLSLIQIALSWLIKGSTLIGLTSLPLGCGGLGETEAQIVYLLLFFFLSYDPHLSSCLGSSQPGCNLNSCFSSAPPLSLEERWV